MRVRNWKCPCLLMCSLNVCGLCASVPCIGEGEVRRTLRETMEWVIVWKTQNAGEREKWEKETDRRRGGLWFVFFHSGPVENRQLDSSQVDWLVWFGIRPGIRFWLLVRVGFDVCLLYLNPCVCVDRCGVGKSGLTGCGLCPGRWHSEMTTEMIPIKEMVWSLNPMRLHVPLTDVIALIGSFVSVAHSLSGCDSGSLFCLSHCLWSKAPRWSRQPLCPYCILAASRRRSILFSLSVPPNALLMSSLSQDFCLTLIICVDGPLVEEEKMKWASPVQNSEVFTARHQNECQKKRKKY